ncbi:hypothetical protein BY458DRAFT_240477 [Sporodiniella umbellata]|nr:hypothetical protein BY458DRAFT_240477 [Sporodiniella umbellata]
MNSVLNKLNNQSLSYNAFTPLWETTSNTIFYLTLGIVLLFLYLTLVRRLRYKNLEYIRNKYPDPDEVLKNPQAAIEVLSITGLKEFPFSFELSLKLALIKTFTVPESNKLLVATGEFKKATARRYEDTDLLLHELADIHGRIGNQIQKDPSTPQKDIDYQWERRDQAIHRMNEIHGKYKIKNEEFISTLTMFITEPAPWINKYEWRKLDVREMNALYRVWYDIGVKMKLKNIPDSYQGILEFRKKYNRFNKINWQCVEPTIRLYISWIPFSNLIFDLSCRILSTFMDPEEAVALGLPKESKVYSSIIYYLFRLRAFFIRHFVLPRDSFATRTPFYPNPEGRYVPEYFLYKNMVYSDGYDLSNIGPEKFVKRKPTGCPFA